MSLTTALDDLSLEQKPLILPELPEDLKKCVFTHPLATIGKAQAVFEVETKAGKIFDYDNDAAIGHAVATACLLKLVHGKYPLLLPTVSKSIVDKLLSVNTLSAISDHFHVIDEVNMPASMDRFIFVDSALVVRSQVFLAYIGALSTIDTTPSLSTLLQNVFDQLIEVEYEQLKNESLKSVEPISPALPVSDHHQELETNEGSVDELFNYIGLLQEMKSKPKDNAQRVVLKLDWIEPTSQGPDHQKVWTAGMTLDGRVVSEATSSKKQDARNLAVGLALSKLGLLESRSSKRARTE